MACTWSCLVASVFIIGMIYSTNATEKSGVLRKYRSQLPADLNERYDKITKERRDIYYQGYVLGCPVCPGHFLEQAEEGHDDHVVDGVYRDSHQFSHQLFLLHAVPQIGLDAEPH